MISRQAWFPIRSDWVWFVPLVEVDDKVEAVAINKVAVVAIDKALVVYKAKVEVNDKVAVVVEVKAMADDRVVASSSNLDHK